jgi:Tol biopolymer transport system component
MGYDTAAGRGHEWRLPGRRRSQAMRQVLTRVLTGAVLLAVTAPAVAAQATPWWQQQKILFMWGQWFVSRADKTKGEYESTVPREVFRNLAQAGVTLYADCDLRRQDGATEYARTHARYAHEFGLKYFNSLFVYYLSAYPGGRQWVQANGTEHSWKCPLDEGIYHKWLVEPNLPLAQEGLLDGIHVDWEFYTGQGEAGLCYCDDCFAKFLESKGIHESVPERASRLTWLQQRGLTEAYEANYHQRRVAMFTRLHEELLAANPDLLVSSYGTFFSDFTRAMNTPHNPFIYLDSRHYGTDDRQPWWESYSARLKQEGYLYIPGGWVNALFGAQGNQVNAARWIYEAAVNEDGCWLWFERELDDEILRAYATAARDIKAVEAKVGKQLFGGQRDPNYVTAVEWSGRPEAEQAILCCTYHLGDEEHLTHINNTGSDWPLRVRLRFPRLAGAERWTVRDPLSDLYYTPDGTTAAWTTEQLRAGVVVSLEPRSDLFLLLAPPGFRLRLPAARLVRSNEFDALPPHAAAASQAGPVKQMINLYTMKNSLYGADLEALLRTTEKLCDLPKAGWRFRMDKEDLGGGAGWFLPQTSLEGWQPIEIERFWGEQGGEGAGWYRSDIDIPALPPDRRIYLHFGAVDEQLVLWIDGQYAGDYDRPPDVGWDKPFAIDVTGKLTAGRHHLALRVSNVSAAGGVWKPVSVLAGPAEAGRLAGAPPDAAPAAGHLVYTASEPMGFMGAEGGLTIGAVVRTVDSQSGTGCRLRQLRGHLWSPRYSPDGKRVAFVHDAGGRGQIGVMNDDGSAVSDLSHNEFCDRWPVWSPDGRRIAFLSDRSGDWDIYVMNADGSGQQHLAGNPGLDRAPAWSPDGRYLAWESYTCGLPTVWICNADGSNSHPLLGPGRKVQVTQVEDWQTKDGLFNFAAVDNPFPDNTFFLTSPTWSPDSTRIAAVLDGRGGYGSDVVLVPVDGSRLLKLTSYIGCSGVLAWSPDGKQLAAAFRCPSESERAGIFVINADRSDGIRGGRVVVEATPQGPRLGGGQRHGLLSWYSQGSAQPRRVVKSFPSLAWSPDGKSLAFSSDMAPDGGFYVYTVSPAGGPPARLELTRSAWPQQIMWRPTE